MAARRKTFHNPAEVTITSEPVASTLPGETPEAKLVRIGTPRAEKAGRAIDNLLNLAGPGYGFDEAAVAKLLEPIEASLATVRDVFRVELARRARKAR